MSKTMTARECTIAALTLKQPDAVPHFELEMQLTEEYFKKRYSSPDDWSAALDSTTKTKLLSHDARLLLETAEYFDYGIIFYSGIHRPTFEDYREGLRMLAELSGGRHLLMAHGEVTPGIPNGNNMDEIICDMLMNPEIVKEEGIRNVATMVERVSQLKMVGLEGIIECADYCFNSGPYLSPAMFSDLITPTLTALNRELRRMNLYSIKHTDGNIMPILNDLIESGPHAIHSLDPMAGVDIKTIKKIAGAKVCIIGNVNCALMQTGTDAEVLNSCAYAMENGKTGGGYIFSTSNVIFKGMPRARYDLMLKYYKSHCAY